MGTLLTLLCASLGKDLYKSESCSRIALVSRTRLLQDLNKKCLGQDVLGYRNLGQDYMPKSCPIIAQVILFQILTSLGQDALGKINCPSLAQVILRKISCTRFKQDLDMMPWGIWNLGQNYLPKSYPRDLAGWVMRRSSFLTARWRELYTASICDRKENRKDRKHH